MTMEQLKVENEELREKVLELDSRNEELTKDRGYWRNKFHELESQLQLMDSHIDRDNYIIERLTDQLMKLKAEIYDLTRSGQKEDDV